VKVHYEGKLIDARCSTAPSSAAEPLTLKPGSIIKCWGEGLAHDEGRRQESLVCPSDLSDGDQAGRPRSSPARRSSFEIELLEIVK